MSNRLALHEELCTVLGSRNVYFQPPDKLLINYPCIIYHRNNDWIQYANDARYLTMERYELTVIDHDPDSAIPDNLVGAFKYCKIDNRFVSDNLNHTTLNLFY